MKVTIGLLEHANDVYIVACRDVAEVKAAFNDALRTRLPPGAQVQLSIGEVKVGRVYKNLTEEVTIHAS